MDSLFITLITLPVLYQILELFVSLLMFVILIKITVYMYHNIVGIILTLCLITVAFQFVSWNEKNQNLKFSNQKTIKY